MSGIAFHPINGCTTLIVHPEFDEKQKKDEFYAATAGAASAAAPPKEDKRLLKSISVNAEGALQCLACLLNIDIPSIRSRVVFAKLINFLDKGPDNVADFYGLISRAKRIFEVRHEAAAQYFYRVKNSLKYGLKRELAWIADEDNFKYNKVDLNHVEEQFWKAISRDTHGYEKMQVINFEIDSLCFNLVNFLGEFELSFFESFAKKAEEDFDNKWRYIEYRVKALFIMDSGEVLDYLEERKRFIKRATTKFTIYRMCGMAKTSLIKDRDDYEAATCVSRIVQPIFNKPLELFNAIIADLDRQRESINIQPSEYSFVQYYSNQNIMDKVLGGLWDVLAIERDKIDPKKYFLRKFKKEASKYWAAGL